LASTADPASVAGLPESRLAPDQLAQLPAGSPDAPWSCRATAVLWLQRARTPDFDWRARPAPLAVAGLIEYLDTPVGPYHEVLAGAVLRDGFRPRVQVPFIAVDSLASIHGGRANWALPKTTARFEGEIGRATARAVGDGWSFSVRAARTVRVARTARTAVAGPRLPVRLRFTSTGPLGEFSTRLRATGRPVLVETVAEGETLTGWLGSGRHLAVVLTGRMWIDPPH
jgi:hypothetical protein